jgi:hypothetical protein
MKWKECRLWLQERGYVQGEFTLDLNGLAQRGFHSYIHEDYLIWAFDPDRMKKSKEKH